MTAGEIDLVVIEATENYDWLLGELLHEYQIDGVVANPDPVSDFRRGCMRMLKKRPKSSSIIC